MSQLRRRDAFRVVLVSPVGQAILGEGSSFRLPAPTAAGRWRGAVTRNGPLCYTVCRES